MNDYNINRAFMVLGILGFFIILFFSQQWNVTSIFVTAAGYGVVLGMMYALIEKAASYL